MTSRTKLQLEAALRAKKALQLRTLRFSYDEIAKQCGYSSRSAAFTAVKRELAKIPREAAKELRQVELEGLDIAERNLSRQIAAGNLNAIDRMIKIKRLRAELTGLFDTQAETGVDEVKAVLADFLAAAIKGDEDDADEDDAENTAGAEAPEDDHEASDTTRA